MRNQFNHRGHNSPLLLVVLVIILVVAFGIREALDKPGETFTEAVYCQNAPQTSIEVCVNLDLYLDGHAPSWMYDHDTDRRDDPTDESLPPEEGA